MPIQLPTDDSNESLSPASRFSSFREYVQQIRENERINELVNSTRVTVSSTIKKSYEFYRSKTLIQQLLIAIAAVVALALGILFLIFHSKLFDLLLLFADGWRDMKAGPLIMLILIIVISFPPLIGYSALASLCGMMYGFKGWLYLAPYTIFGSLLSFLACRYLFRDYALRLARSNDKFAALTQTMSESDGFTLLWMIRLCPLPYSFSNGALATIPGVSAANFALATAITSPKLFMHIFVGDRIARLGTEKDFASRMVDILSVIIAVGIGSFTAYTIYSKTMLRVERAEYTQVDMSNERDQWNIDDDDGEVDDFHENYDEDNRSLNEADLAHTNAWNETNKP